MNVLLSNGQLRKTLAAVRSLGSKGVNVICADETLFNPSGFSKYCYKSITYPSPSSKREEFIKWLYNVIDKYDIKMFIPMDDDVIEAILKCLDNLKSRIKIPLPDAKAYKNISDKGFVNNLVKSSGIDCPTTYCPESIEDVYKVIDKLDFPIILKPRKSSGSRGIRKVETKDEFMSVYQDIHKIYKFPMIQELIPTGQRYDACFLIGDKNEIVASFVQKEVRHFPLEMGPSTVQESVYMPELTEICKRVLKSIEWFGVIEFEFMLDKRDNKLKFMEINPRFWNSLYMSIIAGVDFPWLLYNLMLRNDLKKVDNYISGLYCRWMWPADVFHFLANKHRFKLVPSFFAGKNKKVYDDILSRSDLMPLIGFFMAVLRYIFDINMWKKFFKR